MSILKNPDSVDLVQLKGIIWNIAHIGSSEEGLKLIREWEMIPILKQLMLKSSLNVQGTCYYSLCLLSISEKGKEIVGDIDPFSIEMVNQNEKNYTFPIQRSNYPLFASPIQRKIIDEVIKMSNQVTATLSAKEILK